LLPHVVVPAIMAHHLIPLWHLSAAQAGLMASVYAFGYMLAVPVLTALSDHFDARRILLAGSAVSGLATIAFGILADGLWSASLLWGIAGAGFGGAYMPGLKALTDRLPPGALSRSVTLYTSSFSVGVGLSFLISQIVADYYGWRAAFFVTGIAPFAMVATSILLEPFEPKPTPGHPLDFGPVIGYIFGYGAHCFELYGIRTWIVSFWTFVAARNANDVFLGPVAISVLFTLMSLPPSVLGNEAAIRFGRHHALATIMFGSAATALAIGLMVDFSPIVILLFLLVYVVHRSWRKRSADLGNGSERKSSAARRDDGVAFDHRVWSVCVGRLGHRRRFGLGSRRKQRFGMASSVFVARGGHLARSARAVVVAGRPEGAQLKKCPPANTQADIAGFPRVDQPTL
jgi:MFS family permease